MVLLALTLQVAATSTATGPCEERLCASTSVLARPVEPAGRFPAALPGAAWFPVEGSVGPVSARGYDLTGESIGSGLRSAIGAGGEQLYEYSDGYYARLSLHRLASYGTLPLFAAQFFAGQELLNNVDHAAGWARAIHGPAAAGVAGLFLVNTVTGGLNIVEGIRDPDDRGRRIAHSLLMLAADAGFVWTGVTATGAGRYKPDSNELRTQHRKVALGSMGVATIGYLMMLSPFRP